MDNEFGMHDDELEDIIEKPVSRVKVNIFNFGIFELLKKKSKFIFSIKTRVLKNFEVIQ